MTMIKGLHHNAYRCRDSEETRRFYEEFLGLPLRSAMPMCEGRGIHIFFQLGDGSFMAFFELTHKPFDFKEQSPLDLHIALEVEPAEIDTWVEKARAAGVKATDVLDHEFARSVYLTDPNGYVIELTARTPAYATLTPPNVHERLRRWQETKAPPTVEVVANQQNAGIRSIPGVRFLQETVR
jgi:catechol 2,3-dioxygenase-like lactoylglutathione lyase family enzyme